MELKTGMELYMNYQKNLLIVLNGIEKLNIENKYKAQQTFNRTKWN